MNERLRKLSTWQQQRQEYFDTVRYPKVQEEETAPVVPKVTTSKQKQAASATTPPPAAPEATDE